MRLFVFLAVLLGLSSNALAADLAVSVHDTHGMAAPNAVVMVYPAAGAGALRMGGPYRMAQHNIQFDPFVLIVPVGATVGFPNLDTVRHHVYSFSAPHPFELKLYGKDETRTVTFDRPGVVALGCNIHDQMMAFIRVVDTPFAVKTDAAGNAVIHGLPAGAASVKVWHPFMKGADLSLAWKGAGPVNATLDLRPPPGHAHGY